MAHDVFISHAHKDKQFAHAICKKLESARIKCWIAERDISIGEDWTEATRNAIGSSHVMVLLLSENANAAAHMEREMAHAFYTKRVIVPLRLTETLPRRDFLFYLGTVRFFDAFGPPAEEHLEALTTAIHGLIQGRTPARVEMSLRRAEGAAAGSSFSESWIGALQASHYRTLGVLKYIGIAASLVCVVWLFWFMHQPKERQPSLGESHSQGSQSGSPQASEDAAPRPAYTFTRFGLWVAANAGTTPSVQQGPQDAPSVAQGTQPTDGTSFPQQSAEQKAPEEAQNIQTYDDASNPVPRDPLRFANRREGHRGKSRPKGHEQRVNQTLGRRIARLKSRLITRWHQFLARNRDLGNR
jgi:TIR domain